MPDMTTNDPTITRPCFRARPDAIRAAAATHGATTTTAIAELLDLPRSTTAALLGGRPPRAATIAKTFSRLGGDRLETYFDLVTPGPAA